MFFLRFIEDRNIYKGAVKSEDLMRIIRGEGAYLGKSDGEVRNLGYRKGLETLVVPDVNAIS